MKVYIDLVFFMNLIYDFLLLLSVGMLLKRKISILKILLASLFGGISIFLFIIKIQSIIFFLLKIVISFIMCLIAYQYINIKYFLNNIIYLYMTSTILAGFLYYIDNELTYTKIGLLFIKNGINTNCLLLILISPIILLFYILYYRKKNKFNKVYYPIEIAFDNIKINIMTYLDSGNNLRDPITKKPIIIINNKHLKKIYNIRSPMYVPYNTLTGDNLMKCYKPSYIIVNNHKIYNYLIGEVDYNFKDGIEGILNNKLMEDNYV